jgi:hypothetical protein
MIRVILAIVFIVGSAIAQPIAGYYGSVNSSLWPYYIPQSLYTNVLMWYTMDTNPTNYTPWQVIDSGPLAYNGIQTNAAYRPVHTNNFLSFDGANDFFSQTNSIINSNLFTITAWVYPRSTSDMAFAYKYSTANAYGWYIATIAGKARFLLGRGTVQYIDDTVLITNSWHRITGIKNGDAFQLFVDLRLVGASTYSMYDTSEPFRIGSRYYSGAIDLPTYGYIGVTVVYSNAFSGADVTNTYNAEKGLYGL